MENVFQLKTLIIPLLLLLGISLTMTSCSDGFWFGNDIEQEDEYEDDEWGSGPEVDPSDPDAVTDNSTVTDGTDNGVTENDDPPDPTLNVQNPAKIWGHQPNVEASPDQVIFLPFSFQVSSHADALERIFVQISGASTHWRIEKFSGAFEGQVVLSVTIPSRMKTPGEFSVNYRIQDDLGIVSNVLETKVKVVEVADCSDIYFDGSAGLTVRSVNLGENHGKVRVTYNTYTEPDRIDIFYNGNWIHGTGSSISYGQAPPSSDCDDPGDGYVGTSNFFDFDYDPSESRRLDMYVSGCFGGSTYWELWVACPE